MAERISCNIVIHEEVLSNPDTANPIQNVQHRDGAVRTTIFPPTIIHALSTNEKSEQESPSSMEKHKNWCTSKGGVRIFMRCVASKLPRSNTALYKLTNYGSYVTVV
jgi:hypothetical protein